MTQDKLVSKIMESLRPVIRRLVDKETKTVNEWKEYKTDDLSNPTFAKCYAAAKNCNTEMEFAIRYPKLHNTANFHKWMKEFTWFETQKPVNEWTKQECAKESKKYTSEYDFAVGSNNAYRAAAQNGWLDQFYWLNDYVEDDNY